MLPGGPDKDELGSLFSNYPVFSNSISNKECSGFRIPLYGNAHLFTQEP
jgi:hypothetical protein